MHYNTFRRGELERYEVRGLMRLWKRLELLTHYSQDHILRPCAQCIFGTALTFLERNFKVQRDEPLSAQYVLLCCFTSSLMLDIFVHFFQSSEQWWSYWLRCNYSLVALPNNSGYNVATKAFLWTTLPESAGLFKRWSTLQVHPLLSCSTILICSCWALLQIKDRGRVELHCSV